MIENPQDQKIENNQDENEIEMVENIQEVEENLPVEDIQDEESVLEEMGEMDEFDQDINNNISENDQSVDADILDEELEEGRDAATDQHDAEHSADIQDIDEPMKEELFPVEVVESSDNKEKKNPLESDFQTNYVRGIVESLLFVNEKPITLEQIKKVAETISSTEIKKAIADMQKECEENDRGMLIVEIAGGYQMLSNPKYATYIRNFYKSKHKDKLSKPALEALAIIAYKQPVTRADIEIIRGVNSDGVVAHLVNKELIKIVGRKDIPGKPFLYGTTKQFLEYFGLKSLNNLPRLEEFPGLLPDEEKGEEEMYNPDGTPMNTLERSKQQAIQEFEITAESLPAQVIPEMSYDDAVDEEVEDVISPAEEDDVSAKISLEEELKKEE